MLIGTRGWLSPPAVPLYFTLWIPLSSHLGPAGREAFLPVGTYRYAMVSTYKAKICSGSGPYFFWTARQVYIQLLNLPVPLVANLLHHGWPDPETAFFTCPLSWDRQRQETTRQIWNFCVPILCPVAKHGIEMHRTYKCGNVPVVDEQTSFPSDRHHQVYFRFFRFFQQLIVIMFFLALGATLSDTGHGAPAASLFANLHPQNAQASAHTVFF